MHYDFVTQDGKTVRFYNQATHDLVDDNDFNGKAFLVLRKAEEGLDGTYKDIELKVTNTVGAWTGSAIANYGFILKHDEVLEFTTASKFETKYFSGNTHTIYPPCLEVRWDDWSYNTGSLSVTTSPNIVATLANNQSEYQQDSVQRFRVNIRDRYPARAFTATSVYLNNKALPTASYYSIKDLDTEEIVVDYDTIYTKVSCDSTGMYFDVS